MAAWLPCYLGAIFIGGLGVSTWIEGNWRQRRRLPWRGLKITGVILCVLALGELVLAIVFTIMDVAK